MALGQGVREGEGESVEQGEGVVDSVPAKASAPAFHLRLGEAVQVWLTEALSVGEGLEEWLVLQVPQLGVGAGLVMETLYVAEAQGEALGVGAPLGVAVSEGVAVGDVRVLWECEGEGEEQGLAPASEAVGALEEVARGVADTVGEGESEGVTVEEAERE